MVNRTSPTSANTVTRVYRFGCRPPREHARAEQMLGQAWLYREDLRLAYNRHKHNVRAFLAGIAESAHIRAYEDSIASVDEVGHVHRYERSHAWSVIQEALNTSIREARAKRGHLLDAGTYWLIESAMLASSKACKNDPIKKQNFDGTGRIGAEIQSRSQFAASTFAHRRLRLEPVGRYHELTIHVGPLAEKRSITWPIKLHRPFPEGAIVKQVAVQRTRNGHRYRWEALITITYEAAARDLDASGVVGIDIGWRREEEEGKTRVATHDGSIMGLCPKPHPDHENENQTSASLSPLRDSPRTRAHSLEIRSQVDQGFLTIDTIDAFLYCDSVRSIRDQNFDLAKEYAARMELPGADHARQWRNKARLVRVAAKTNELGVSWWVERDKHLEDIEVGVRAHAIHRRLDAFRRYADDLAKRYRIVALEDMPMADWVGEGDTHAHERRRSAAALYLLQLAIVQRFGDERVDWVPAAYTTMTCASCGLVRQDSVGPAVMWVCACGVEHHQDENAAVNIRENCERWIGSGNPVRARKRKAKKEKENARVAAIPTLRTARKPKAARKPIDQAAE